MIVRAAKKMQIIMMSNFLTHVGDRPLRNSLVSPESADAKSAEHNMTKMKRLLSASSGVRTSKSSPVTPDIRIPIIVHACDEFNGKCFLNPEGSGGRPFLRDNLVR